MLLIALLLAQSSPDVVVTAERLERLRASCVRKLCTPLEDAKVLIALAEAQFRDGRYVEAKRGLIAAIDRNKAAAATDPRPVAALYEALATVALHDGDERAFRRGVAGQVNTLRDHLPADDPAVIAVAPALGDMWVKLGKYVEADGVYAAAERTAIAAGRDRAAILLGFRRATVAAALGDQARARRILDRIDANQAASEPEMRKVSRVIRFQMAAQKADDATMATLARDVAAGQGARPALLWSPPYRYDTTDDLNRDNRKFWLLTTILDGPDEMARLQWIDVGFWIRPDGRTDQQQVLRSSKSAPWTPAVLSQIAGRRYAASAPSSTMPDLGGIYRIERITKRTQYVTPRGSLVRRRVPAGGFEVIDLTDGDARVAPAAE